MSCLYLFFEITSLCYYFDKNQLTILMNTLNVLQQKIKNAKSLDFGTIFNQSIELFKKVWVQGLILYLITTIVGTLVAMIFFGPMYIAMFEQIINGNSDPEALNLYMYDKGPIFMLLYYLVLFLVNIFNYLLYAGFYRIIKKIDYDESFLTSDFFYYFKKEYIGKAVVLIIVTSIISFVAIMLCVLPIFYVIVPIVYMTVFFSFKPDMSIGDIITLGFNLGNKKWGITFGLGLVSFVLVVILFFLTCGLGILFFSAFMFLPIYLIYKEVIGFEDSDPINQIGNPEL